MTEKEVMALSEQAVSLVIHLKDFDIEDFKKWWSNLNKVTQIGTGYIFQYVDMKSRGKWKDENFTIPEITWQKGDEFGR